MRAHTGLEIAVIGMSGKFPKADNVQQYWDNLVRGEDCISDFSALEAIGEGELKQVADGPDYVRSNAYLDNKTYFDAGFFNYRREEAELMDPQMRIFHECCWEALEDSGYGDRHNRGKTGIFGAGTVNNPWIIRAELKNLQSNQVDPFIAQQLRDVTFLSTRISYAFDLKGPSVFLQTACSSSLVAIHEACNSLLLGECVMALAGGVTIRNFSKKGYTYKEGMILSQDGKCRPFDGLSSGSVGGEGAGVVVLKRLADATRDRDSIYAVILGTSINNDGSNKVGYTAPGVKGQAEVIKRAQKMARVSPDDIGFVESHGTATELGDSIEVEALNEVFKGCKPGSCVLGSVKSAIGHLDSASGVASFIKSVLALRDRKFPATLHYQAPNRKVNFEKGPFYVSNELTELHAPSGALKGGVSSFGIGGTNAHVVLESAPERTHSSESRAHQLILLSAKTKKSLSENCKRLAEYLKSGKSAILPDVAYTLKTGRERFRYRKTLVCKTIEDAAAALLRDPDIANSVGNNQEDLRHIVFMFPGEETGYYNMCSDLYLNEKAFREQVDQCLEIADRYNLTGVLHTFFSDPQPGLTARADLRKLSHYQLLLFVVEYSLSRLLMQWGVHPAFMIGQGVGEYVAACVSRVLSLEDAIRLVIAREEATVRNDVTDAFGQTFSTLDISEPEIPCISGITGDFVKYEQLKSRSYWSAQLREAPQFLKGINKLLSEGNATFLEVGPGCGLSTLAEKGKSVQVKSEFITMVRQEEQNVDDQQYLMAALGSLWGSGVKINWSEFYSGQQRNKVPLPTYSFERAGFTADFDLNKLIGGQNRNLPSQNDERTETRKKVHIPAWVTTASPNELPAPADSKDHILVFADDAGWSDMLVEKLRMLGRQVVTVNKGESFRQVSDGHFEANLSEPVEYEELWKGLEYAHCKIDHIIYCTFLTQLSQATIYEKLAERLDRGYLGLSYLARSIANTRQTHEIELTVLNNHSVKITSEDEIDPLKAMINGPALVMPLELLNIRSKIIDIPHPYSVEKWKDTDLQWVINEVFYRSEDQVVAYRYRERWVKTFRNSEEDPKLNNGVSIRPKATYIITGGFGGMGFTLAKNMIYEHGANVILVHRSFFPERGDWDTWLLEKGADDAKGRMIRELMQMEATGNTVYLHRADVAEEQQVKAFFQDLARKRIDVNGLIWAAGEVDFGGIIQNRTKGELIKYVKSKVHALLYFEKYMAFESLDFVALFSSIGNVFYQIKFGQAAYNAANEFLESYPHYIRRKKGIHAFAINWCDWYDVGMAFKLVKKQRRTDDAALINANIDFGIYPEEGVNVFHKCLQSKEPASTIYAGNIIDAIQEFRETFSKAKSSLVETQDAAVQTADENFNLEQKLVEIFSGFFGKDDIGVTDDFFELGGDSLKAITLVGRINKIIGSNLTIRDIYNRPNIRELLGELESIQLVSHVAIPKAPSKKYYVLSSAQKRMYFLYEFNKSSLAYNQPNIIRLKGLLDKARLHQAFERLVERHESLRTGFKTVENEVFQEVAEYINFVVEHVVCNEEEVDAVIGKFVRPFELQKPPLIRVAWVECRSDDHFLLIDMHHIISDGTSRRVLLKDFMSLYNNEDLPVPGLQYKDYAEWQQSEAHQNVLVKAKAFWLREFENPVSALALPLDFARPAMQTFEGDAIDFELDSSAVSGLKHIAGKEGTTMYVMLLSLLNVLLCKLSQQTDIVIGTPVAGRQHADFERMIGMFTNTLVLRNYPSGAMRFVDLLQEVKSRTLACFENQSYPYESLLNDLKVERDTSRNALFDIMFVFQNIEAVEFTLPGFTLEGYDYDLRSAKFDLTLEATERQGKILMNLEFNTRLFRRETVECFIKYYHRIISIILKDPSICISEISLLSSQEKRQLLNDFNDTEVDYPKDKTLIDLFESQVGRTPGNIALRHGEAHMCYADLNILSDRISGYLQEAEGVMRGDLIGIMLERELYMIPVIFGILKAGCAYVPIDPRFPRDRINSIITDSKMKVLVSRSAYIFQEATNLTRLVDLDDRMVTITNHRITASSARARGHDLAYVIYTSGSTGIPKGVMIEHHSVVNRILWMQRVYELSASDVLLQKTPVIFDVSVWELFGWSVNGASISILPPGAEVDPRSIIAAIEAHQVTAIHFVPSMLSVFLSMLQKGDDHDRLRSLRWVFSSGEALKPEHVKNFRERIYRYNKTELINLYGPTEATVEVSYYRCCLESNEESAVIPIGKPIDNTQLYVLDASLGLCPVGVRGELCISGVCLSRGYLSNMRLTEEKFVDHPYKKGLKLYKTGDLAYWQADGAIVYVGRIDNQVKLRGYRIEMGEIESRLNSHEQISGAMVVVHEDGEDKYLAGYYVSEINISAAELRRHLSMTLPDYMVPGYFMRLDEMPLTANGKADRRKLPKPQIQAEQSFVPPSNEIEERLALIWSEVLRIDKSKVGMNSNFFEIGGHSLNLLKVHGIINSKFNVSISVADMFRLPKISSLADYILNGDGKVQEIEAELNEREEILGIVDRN